MTHRIFAYSILAVLVLVNVAVDHSFVEDIRKVLAKRPLPSSHYSECPPALDRMI